MSAIAKIKNDKEHEVIFWVADILEIKIYPPTRARRNIKEYPNLIASKSPIDIQGYAPDDDYSLFLTPKGFIWYLISNSKPSNYKLCF